MAFLTSRNSGIPSLNDLIHFVDIDDFTGSLEGTSKKMTIAQLKTLVDSDNQDLQSVLTSGSIGSVNSPISITATNTGATSGVSNISMSENDTAISYESGTTSGVSNISMSNIGMFVLDEISQRGLQYSADYSSNFTMESLVTKRWVENQGFLTSPDGNGIFDGNGTIPSNTVATITDTFSLNGGNVGIGVSSPNEKLEVEGNLLFPITSALKMRNGLLDFDFLKASQSVGAVNIMIGKDSSGTDSGGGGFISIGDGSESSDSGIAIGRSSSVSSGSIGGIAIGRSSSVSSGTVRGIAIGRDTSALHSGTFVLGYNVSSDSVNQFKYGDIVNRHTFLGSVGVGTTNTFSKMHIRGWGSTDATSALRVEKSNSSISFYVRDDGFTGINTFLQAQNEKFRANGNAIIDGVLAMGSAAIQGNAISTPANWSLNVAGTKIVGTTSDTTFLDASANGIILFRNEADDVIGRFDPLKFSITAFEANNIATINNKIFNISSEYWDGATSQIKEFEITHNVTASPSGDSQAEFGIAGNNIMTLKDTGVVNMSNLPASSVGLSSGDIWNNLGVLNIV